jgi:sugar phosphate isomerase/epimerase
MIAYKNYFILLTFLQTFKYIQFSFKREIDMKTSTQTDCLQNTFGIEKAIEIISCVGFDAIDISLFTADWEENPLSRSDYKEYARYLKSIAKCNGTYFNQSHAPFPSFKEGNDEYNTFIYPAIVKAIEFSAEIGASQVIVHPFVMKKNQKKENLKFFNSLLPHCKEYNIKVALENMFGRNKKTGRLVPNVCSTGKELSEYVDALDSKYFTACLDIGHAGLVGETAVNMIHALGHDRLTALHVHDNNMLEDMHTLPFTRDLDFEAITAALKDIKYSGDMTLESDHFLYDFPDELKVDATRLMAVVAKYLAKKSS